MKWPVAVAVACVATAFALATLAGGEARAGGPPAPDHVFVRDGDPARTFCGAPPVGWQAPGFDDRAWMAHPLAVERRDSGAPVEADARGDGGVVPCSPRFARWRFRADGELGGLQTLTLRIRYTHGFAAYLNGVEVARRRLPPNAQPDDLASDVHGPEFERFTIPARALVRGDNVLAVEVHPHTAGRDTTVELSLTGEDGPRLVRGPYLLGLGEREVTVVFDTDLPTAAEVRWGPTDDYGSRAGDAFGRHHVIKLTPLRPGTVYHYRVRARTAVAERGPSSGAGAAAGAAGAAAGASGAGASAAGASGAGAASQSGVEVDVGDAVFHTPPESGRTLRFAVYGDVRSGHDIHAALDQTLAAEEPDLAILTGDLVDRGSDEGDWERFFEISGPLLRTLPIFPAIGNHEYASRGHGLVAFMQYFRWPVVAAADEPPWYSFDVSGVHFVALDSNSYKAPRQLSWLDHDLREARRRGVRAIFVYAHEGPASSGLHGDNQICAREYVPVFERYHVSMFFGGHDHDFERGRIGTLDYVVTGGGGAELRTARCGVPGKRACPPRVASFVNDHNYVMVEVLPSLFRVCPKRVDGTPLEACTQYPLR